MTITVTKKELDELVTIIDTCQSHLQDYDLDEEDDEEGSNTEINNNCEKWLSKLEALYESNEKTKI